MLFLKGATEVAALYLNSAKNCAEIALLSACRGRIAYVRSLYEIASLVGLVQNPIEGLVVPSIGTVSGARAFCNWDC